MARRRPASPGSPSAFNAGKGICECFDELYCADESGAALPRCRSHLLNGDNSRIRSLRGLIVAIVAASLDEEREEQDDMDCEDGEKNLFETFPGVSAYDS